MNNTINLYYGEDDKLADVKDVIRFSLELVRD